jgi:hypothetical protein
MKMANNSGVDIFEVLDHADRKDVNYFKNLTRDQQKKFVPVVVARWLTGTYNKQQLILLNEFINPYLYSLHDHKDLLWKMITVCTSGNKTRYSWIKTNSNSIKHPESIKCIKKYFNYNTQQATLCFNTISNNTVLDLAEELGYQDSELNLIRKELGFPTTRKRKNSTKLEGFDF